MSETYAKNAINDPDAAALTAAQDAEYVRQTQAKIVTQEIPASWTSAEGYEVVLDGNIVIHKGDSAAFAEELKALMIKHSVEQLTVAIVRVRKIDDAPEDKCPHCGRGICVGCSLG